MELQHKRGMGRKVLLSSALGLGALSLAGCDVDAPGGTLGKFLAMGWPTGVTPEATAMYNFWSWVWVAAWIIGIIVWGIFIWAMVGWSAKRAEKAGKGEFPRQTQYNIPVELVLTVVPIIIVMGLFFFTVQVQDKVTALDKDPKVTVDVTGYQWNWKFGYGAIAGEFTPNGQDYDGTDEERQAAAEASKVDPDGNNPVHGRSKSDVSFLRMNEIETLGTSEEIPVLVLPTGTPIEFDLASADVALTDISMPVKTPNSCVWIPAAPTSSSWSEAGTGSISKPTSSTIRRLSAKRRSGRRRLRWRPYPLR